MKIVKMFFIVIFFSLFMVSCAENDIDDENSITVTNHANQALQTQDEEVSEDLRLQKQQIQQRKSQPPERIYRF